MLESELIREIVWDLETEIEHLKDRIFVLEDDLIKAEDREAEEREEREKDYGNEEEED